MPDPLSLPAAARALGVCESSVRNWIKQGELPAMKVGPAPGRYRIERHDLDRVRQPVTPDLTR